MDMKSFVRGLGVSLSFAVLVSGCIYSEGNDFGDWDDDGDFENAPNGGVGACFVFCEKLAECGTLEVAAQDACIDNCHAKHDFTPALTEQGATCVIDQACKALTAYDCPGAPFPPSSVGDEGAGGSGGSSGSAGSGGSGGSGGSQPVSCQGDCDCPSGTTCQQGVCG